MRWLPLLALTVLAAAPRLFRIDAQSLWYDEGISAFQLTRSFPDIVRAAALDTHPPLYYWTLKAWAHVFGASELGLRALSAVLGVAAVVLVWLIGRRLFGPRLATLAALLLAWSPLAVYYSQEVRMYMQVTTLGLLAVWAYVRRSYWLYALAGIATLYSQYLGLAVLVAVNVHAVIDWRRRPIRDWLAWLGANALVGLAFWPWLPTFVAQQSHSLNTSPRTPAGLLLETLSAYGGGLARGELVLAGGGLLVGLALLGVVLERGDNRSAVWLAVLVWLVPLALVIGLGLRSGLFELRYLVPTLPGLALLAALGIARSASLLGTRALAAGLAGLALIAPTVGLTRQYFDPALARDDYRGLVQTIQREARPGDAIVLSAPNQIEVFSFYYQGALDVVPLPAQRPIDPDDTRRRLETIRAEHERVWLVDWAMDQADPPGVIASWLADNAFQASHSWFGTIQLRLFGFEAPGAAARRVDLPLDNGVVLEGYRLGQGPLHPGDTLALTLVWRAEQGATAAPWKVFAHVLGGDGKVIAQRDAEPADNLRPTTTWRNGERIEDNLGIVLPDDLAPGAYPLEIGMYRGDQRARFAGQGDHLVLGEVVVDSGSGVLGHERR